MRTYVFQPCGMIIFIVNDFQFERGSVSGQFVPPLSIFLIGDDIRVAEKHPRPESFLDHPFQNSCRTRSAATVKQDTALFQVDSLRHLRPETTSLEMSHDIINSSR